MKKIHSERWALAALIALVIYCLACWYPASWSPDSDRVVLPLLTDPSDGGVLGLVMVDLRAQPIRDVARASSDRELFSPAAWSADGKWIAYFKFELRPKDEDEEDPRLDIDDAHTFALMLQDAESGKERAIVRGRIDERDEGAFQSNVIFGPQWASDSQTIAIRKMDKDAPGVLILNTKGEVLSEIPLQEKASLVTASLSPDGRHLAYLAGTEEPNDKTSMRIYDLAAKSETVLASVVAEKVDDNTYPLPVWSADGAWLYLATNEKRDGDEQETALVKRIAIKTGKTETVWEREDALVTGLSISSGTGSLAIDFMLHSGEDIAAIEVADSAGGEPTPLHFGKHDNEFPMSTAISPDGKWVALSLPARRDDDVFWVGTIASADGRELRFFLPEPKIKGLIPEIVKNRLETALKVVKLEATLAAALEEIDFSKLSNEESIQAILATADRIAGEHKAPIFQEAIAYGKVRLFLEMIGDPPPAARVKLLATAERLLKEFLAAYPDHPLGPALRQQLDEFAKAPAEPPEADVPEAE